MPLFRKLKSFFAPKEEKPSAWTQRVNVIPEGFKDGPVEGSGPTVPWTDVRCIRAYKRCNLSVDEVCLAFLLKDESKAWIEISEGVTGFSELSSSMEKAFPTIAATWWNHVAFPPFETRDSVLWSAAPNPES